MSDQQPSERDGPVPPRRYGRMPRSFADPMPHEEGSCRHCGAVPPCRVPTDDIVEALADAAGLDKNGHNDREEPRTMPDQPATPIEFTIIDTPAAPAPATIAGALRHHSRWTDDDRVRAAAVLAQVAKVGTPVFHKSHTGPSLAVRVDGQVMLWLDAGRIVFHPRGQQFAPADARPFPKDERFSWIPLSRHLVAGERSTTAPAAQPVCDQCWTEHPAGADCY